MRLDNHMASLEAYEPLALEAEPLAHGDPADTPASETLCVCAKPSIFSQCAWRMKFMLKKIEESVQVIAHTLHAVCETSGAAKVRFSFRITPDAGVWAADYWFTRPDGTVRKDFPERELESLVEEAAVSHWHLVQDLGQPRWYMITVNVEYSGKYSVDFEYRDDYQEGDIMNDLK